MLRLNTETETDGLKLIRTGRVLSACHGRSKVIRKNNGDATLVIHRIEQASHTRMREGRVTDNRNGRMQSCIRRTFSHCDRGAHIHTAVDRTEGRQCAQRITANITKDACIGIFGSHPVESIVYITMSTSLTQGWRARHHMLRLDIRLFDLHPKRLAHTIGSKLAHTRQFTCQTSPNGIVSTKQCLHLLLHHGLTVLGNEQRLALSGKVGYHLLRKRILRNLQHGNSSFLGLVLHYIVIGNATSDDTQLGFLIYDF